MKIMLVSLTCLARADMEYSAFYYHFHCWFGKTTGDLPLEGRCQDPVCALQALTTLTMKPYMKE